MNYSSCTQVWVPLQSTSDLHALTDSSKELYCLRLKDAPAVTSSLCFDFDNLDRYLKYFDVAFIFSIQTGVERILLRDRFGELQRAAVAC